MSREWVFTRFLVTSVYNCITGPVYGSRSTGTGLKFFSRCRIRLFMVKKWAVYNRKYFNKAIENSWSSSFFITIPVNIFAEGLSGDEFTVSLFDVKFIAVEFVGELSTRNHFFCYSPNFHAFENVPVHSLKKEYSSSITKKISIS